MESAVLGVAFAFTLGMLVSRIGLPPLVGFLIAGFSLNMAGVDTSTGIHLFADLGVTLLLFTIGLKLDIKSIAQKPFWGSALIQLVLTLALFAPTLMMAGAMGLPMLDEIDWRTAILLAFALSFSSTVFVIKILQEKGEGQSLYGQLAIAILIIQDLFAVIYLTVSKGEWPSIWALGLFLIPVFRPFWFSLLKRSGHGEMLLLYGLCMALGLGYGLFSLVGIKGDLGALMIGIMLAPHAKSNELSKSLYSLKELFLVGFFLDIGLRQLPDQNEILIAVCLLALLPLKSIIFAFAIRIFNLRIRTTLQASASLTNFSEFGLIVCAIAVSSGALQEEWLTVMALTLALSFIISAPLNQQIGKWYVSLRPRLGWLQPRQLNALDRPIALGQTQFLVVGMGRIGTGTYEYLDKQFGNVAGVDSDSTRIEHHERQNRNVINADATDPDFWHKVELSGSLRAVFLAMPEHTGNYYAAIQLSKTDFAGDVAAIVRYFDEEKQMANLGVTSVFNVYREAGKGFAQDSCDRLGLINYDNPQTELELTDSNN
ncbi:cation:proton antiporter family protein [Echinimonas agarilytica]|uniref:Cation:proton antiporter n=1 Tax=Echinimonas agarilytica TaxID=1215918 RepID=A0AA41W6F6_9GAMM|nr:cation:proton antiporter family protein [Echinimonas agarilytica]MCM2679563.1 cation:proton antiporter [Echinimonas agarilytica]